MAMIAQSPLNDSTNNMLGAEPYGALAAEATPAPTCFLSLLAEASLERLHDAKRPRVTPNPLAASLECAEALPPHLVALETSVRSRCPSRVSADAQTSSSRSTSPLSGPGANGKAFLCNRCGREYASTDAVRKHARQNHPDWLKEQGQGCPSLYCTVVEASGSQMAVDAAPATKTSAAPEAAIKAALTPPPSCVAHLATAVAAHVAAAPSAAMPAPPAPALQPAAVKPVVPTLTVSAAAPAMAMAPPAPSPADPSAAHLLAGLMTAAESCVALSMAAHDSEEDEEDEGADDYAVRADRLAYLMEAHERNFGGAMPAPPSGPPLRGGAAVAAKAAREGRTGMKRPRSVRCGKCDGCEGDDCGRCKNCVDKPKFGGIGMRKQGCIRKICRTPRMAV